MAIGDIIINLFHSQDIRFLSSGYSFTKSSSYIIGVSLMNLLGLPFISGFFSKDLVLETCNFSIVSYIVLVVIFINVLFTFNYRYSLFYFIFSSLKTSSFFIYSSPILLHSVLLFSLSIVSVVFGSFWLNSVLVRTIHVCVPLTLKLTPFILNLITLSFLILFLKLPRLHDQPRNFYFSNIIFLSCLLTRVSSNLYISISFLMVKTSESGFYDNFLNKSTSKILLNVSKSLFNYGLYNPFVITFSVRLVTLLLLVF